MDLLQKELLRKKQVLAKAKQDTITSFSSSSSSSKKRKYWKQSELRRLEEEEEEKEKEREELLRKQQQQQQHQQQVVDENGNVSKKPKPSTNETQPQSNKESSNNNNNQKKQTKTKKSSSPNTITTTAKTTSTDGMDTTTTTTTSTLNTNTNTLTKQEMTRRLRSLGLPVMYFGETLQEQWERLQQALEQETKTLQGLSEMEEFRLGKGHGIRNPFLERDTSHEKKQSTKKQQQQPPPHQQTQKGTTTTTTASTRDRDPDSNTGTSTNPENDNTKQSKDDDNNTKNNNDDDDNNDPPKIIYKYFKGLLKEWEYDLEQRPASIAKSVAGKNESKTLKQCKDYIRPLFKLLKQRQLEGGLQAHLLQIVHYAQDGEFVKAHDAYLDVAIGRAAWPIGVTMVGIHARSGRAKIESSKVAHVMNSELQRKYLTSVKRLLSFAQKKRPDVDPSKKVA